MKYQITPCLWFDGNAEEAARFYMSVFKNSKINGITYYGKEGFEVHNQPEGTVLTVEFEINGQTFTAFNGGPEFLFSESVSFQVYCDTQPEEQIAYGMPAYKTNKKPLIYFGAFKNHIGLYATPEAHTEFKDELSGYKQGKGSVQFPLNRPILYELIERIIKFKLAESNRK